jgi:hypothetical protein
VDEVSREMGAERRRLVMEAGEQDSVLRLRVFEARPRRAVWLEMDNDDEEVFIMDTVVWGGGDRIRR